MNKKTFKIELSHPYNKVWRLGYTVINNEGRKMVILFKSSKERTTTSYARYLMAVSIGRFLNKSEHVDHINNDKTDDRIENLQILSQSENSKKARLARYAGSNPAGPTKEIK